MEKEAANGHTIGSLAHHGFEVDYLALVDALTLEPLAAPRPPSRLIAAARLGGVRLIDNLPGH